MVSVKLSLAMSGFGIALGFPFALFDISYMAKILTKIRRLVKFCKSSLGFLEIALAIKFLSNADLVEQWGLIKRGPFLLFGF